MRRITLSIVPLLFAAGLIFYKTRTSLAVLRAVWTTGVIASRPEVVSLGYAGAAVDALYRMQHMVVVIPVDSDVDETQHIAQKYGRQRHQRCQVAAVRHL